MRRRYKVAAGEDAWCPPARRPVSPDGRGLTARHWVLLETLALRGVLDTAQAAVLMSVSRPSASRYLGVLVRAGLVWRFVYEKDPSHLAHYEASTDGIRLLKARLERQGRPVPAALGHGPDEFVVNDFFVRLTAHAVRTGAGYLYQWWRALEATDWLHRHGVPGTSPHGLGVWVEGDVVVRFLLHLDHQRSGPLIGTPTSPPSQGVAGYRNAVAGVPASAVLVVTADDGRERLLHDEVGAAPMPVTVASTTRSRLYATTSPADAIWSVATDSSGRLVRLVDVPPRRTRKAGGPSVAAPGAG
ncbi:replication-relaxation family protein [Polymorphospora sp. NPDC050346]|uniref:replication-relaxation family protein n=1 Tax=Polymorphospora sp. NPDC050346 TaxID=3155780 RepID=UPI0033F5DD92